MFGEYSVYYICFGCIYSFLTMGYYKDLCCSFGRSLLNTTLNNSSSPRRYPFSGTSPTNSSNDAMCTSSSIEDEDGNSYPLVIQCGESCG